VVDHAGMLLRMTKNRLAAFYRRYTRAATSTGSTTFASSSHATS
jgi:hypothetical protein